MRVLPHPLVYGQSTQTEQGICSLHFRRHRHCGCRVIADTKTPNFSASPTYLYFPLPPSHELQLCSALAMAGTALYTQLSRSKLPPPFLSNDHVSHRRPKLLARLSPHFCCILEPVRAEPPTLSSQNDSMCRMKEMAWRRPASPGQHRLKGSLSTTSRYHDSALL